MIPTSVYRSQVTQQGGSGGLVNICQPGAGTGSPLQQPKFSILARPSVPFQTNQITASQLPNPQIVYQSKETRQEKPVQLKTPLALLNEICTKHGIIPKQSVTEEGAVHNRTFTVTVSIEHQGETWEGGGKAHNLKMAKQEAARNLLINIDAKNERMITELRKEVPTPAATPASNASTTTSVAQSTTVIPEGNPVGDLGELCMKFKFSMPVYTDEVAPGGASFVSICTVGENVKGEGQASTKKVAKKLAAAEALKSLTEFLKSRLGEKLSSDEVDFKKLTRLFTKFNVEDNNTTNTNIATTTSNVKFASLEDKLLYFRDCVGPKVDLLTKTSLKELQKCDPLEVLSQLCEEQNWKTEFVDFVPTEDEPKHRSIVSCTIEGHSLFLLSGLGSSASQARKMAVVEVLGMLRHLLRK